ncbi:MAG TPA: hypothetical protein VMI75_04135 [Polyangiaceae bacterium]|nr:hypothetical protein [Polyangiaceae bacterium]
MDQPGRLYPETPSRTSPSAMRDRDPADQKRLIGILEEQLREGEMAADGEVILDAVAAGDSHEEIANELGISRAAVKQGSLVCARPSLNGSRRWACLT